MTNEEAIKYLIPPTATSTHPSESFLIQKEAYELAIKALEERPTGEWIIISEDTEGIHHIKCPFCKYEKGSEFTPYIKITFDELPYFCEKCGADLRGGKE